MRVGCPNAAKHCKPPANRCKPSAALLHVCRCTSGAGRRQAGYGGWGRTTRRSSACIGGPT
eukprot:14278026-Alexandrium_andersonii.AAC.1